MRQGFARWSTPLIAILALASVSWAGPLIRLATEAPPTAIAFWRTLIAGFVLVPWALAGRGRTEHGSGRPLLFALAGLFLAAHFATWIASVDLTTIASSVLIVSLQPLIVGVLASFMGDTPTKGQWAAIGIACTGALLVGLDAGEGGRPSATGNLLAFAGAVFGAGYLLAGKKLRDTVRTARYASAVYLIAAIFLLVFALFSGDRLWGFEQRTWLFILLLAAGPQLAGHTGLNYLLPKMGVTWVVLAMMAEPVGSAVIAAFLFGEVPGGLVYPGGGLILAGILLYLRLGRDDLRERDSVG